MLYELRGVHFRGVLHIKDMDISERKTCGFVLLLLFIVK